LEGPAIVRSGRKREEVWHAATLPGPANDVRKPAIIPPKSKAAPAIVQHQEGPKSRIVQAAKPKGRRKVWADDGQETPPEIKALIARMMLGRGPT
jgi:hypothetical protein